MFAVQPVGGCQGDEELGAIGVWTTVRHGYYACSWEFEQISEKCSRRIRRKEVVFMSVGLVSIEMRDG